MSANEESAAQPVQPANRRLAWGAVTLAVLALLLLSVVALRAMGRTWWCTCSTPHLFVTGVWSPHNSQHLLDPYTFSHVQHGLVLYAVLVLLVPKVSPAVRAVVAIAIECGWEVVENSSWIIDRYRESTVSLEYYGDSIVNSIADIGACVLGYAAAASVPVAASVVAFAAIELAMLLSIRDSLLLNVLMLVRPIDAIRDWQMGG